MPKRHKITQLVPGKDGWSQWICPRPKARFRMVCCKCGNTHWVQFRTFLPVNEQGGKFEVVLLPPMFRTMYRARQGRRIK